MYPRTPFFCLICSVVTLLDSGSVLVSDTKHQDPGSQEYTPGQPAPAYQSYLNNNNNQHGEVLQV